MKTEKRILNEDEKPWWDPTHYEKYLILIQNSTQFILINVIMCTLFFLSYNTARMTWHTFFWFFIVWVTCIIDMDKIIMAVRKGMSMKLNMSKEGVSMEACNSVPAPAETEEESPEEKDPVKEGEEI